ncbi:MAG: hypothetical protein H6565_05360 [Lewinellaceae bacterium]|nr:hypothetical protein [Lewinellaceae bacterium]
MITKTKVQAHEKGKEMACPFLQVFHKPIHPPTPFFQISKPESQLLQVSALLSPVGLHNGMPENGRQSTKVK